VTSYVDLRTAVAAVGLTVRGGFVPQPADGVPPLPDGRLASAVILVGMTDRAHWDAFRAAPESRDGQPHPLDRWGHRVLAAVAERTGAALLEPSVGPPWWPFQRWAQRAEAVHPSPLGLLIHPDFGLWHAYRGALAFADAVDLPPVHEQPSPCATCRDRPCLSGCPVGAYTTTGFAVDACATYLSSALGERCLSGGCLARRACPIGQRATHGPDQARFHLEAFVRHHRV
jgi:hypothetical protein